MSQFEEYYTSNKKWGGKLNYEAKIQMTRYYVWDHPTTLCLAFSHAHLIYCRCLCLGLSCGGERPTDGGYIGLALEETIENLVDNKWERIHLILCDTEMTPLRRKVIDRILNYDVTVTVDDKSKLAEIYENDY